MLAEIRGGGFRQAFLWLVIGVFTLAARAGYGGGGGTAGDPYLIFTAEQFDSIRANPQDWDRQFRLMADIDLARYGPGELSIIGTPESGAFTGVFDGNYRTISNFRCSSEFGSYIGLFGLVDGTDARIENVTLVDPSVTTVMGRYAAALVGLLRAGTVANCHVRAGSVSGENVVGGLVGRNEEGKIIDCTAAITVRGLSRLGGLVGSSYFGAVRRCEAVASVLSDPESGSWNLGGLIGENSNGTVTECRATGIVQGNRYVGGLAGDNLLGRIDRCWADGTVSGEHDVGGLVGQNRGGIVTDSYALAEVTGVYYIGGLAGQNTGSCQCTATTPSLIARCYAAGPIAAVGNAGGLVALNDRSDVVDSFWDIEATGRTGSDGGQGRTTAEMHERATYVQAGWDFLGEKKNGTEAVWSLRGPKRYPQLAWQVTPGDFDADGDVDFRDYAVLAGRWRQIDTAFWSGGTYIAPDAVVDFDDLERLTNAWLSGRK